MKIRKVVHMENMPSRPPLITTCVIFLMLDHFNSSDFVWGISAGLVFLLWVSYIILKVTEKGIKIFKEETNENRTRS